MKKLLPILTMFILIIAFTFAGCGEVFSDGPANNATIASNGGAIVQKGDYVYYVNGYEAYSTLGEGNKNKLGAVELSAIYRAKLVDGVMSEQTKMVSKVAGYEYTNLYISGEYLYFVTPNTQKDKTGAVHFEYVSINKIKLDGSKLSTVYTTNQYSSGKTSFVNVGGVDYALIFDGASIIRIELAKKDKIETIATEITGAVLTNGESAQSQFIYTTRARNDAEGANEGITGNVLQSINIIDKTVQKISGNTGESITLNNWVVDKVYFTLDSMQYSFTTTKAFTKTKLSNVTYTSFVAIGNDAEGSGLGYVVNYESKLYYQAEGSVMPNLTPFETESATIIKAIESKVYYFTSSAIKVFDAKDQTVAVVANTELGTISSKLADVIGNRYLLFSTKPEGSEANEYLFAFDLYKAGQSEEKPFVCGVIAETDLPDEDAEETDVSNSDSE